jgi:hypothetical protein
MLPSTGLTASARDRAVSDRSGSRSGLSHTTALAHEARRISRRFVTDASVLPSSVVTGFDIELSIMWKSAVVSSTADTV